MKYKKILLFFRIVLVAVPIVFLGFLVSKDLFVSGSLEASYNFKDSSPFVLPLAPKARLTEIKCDEKNGCYQAMFDDPVYFDVRLPRQVNTIEFSVKYKTEDLEDEGLETVRLGSFINKDLWQFEVKDFDEVIDLDDNWKIGKVSFEMSSKRFGYQKYQFMISMPEIRGSGREILISEIAIKAVREPLTIEKIISKLR